MVAVVRDGSLFVVRRPGGETARFLAGVDLTTVATAAASPDGLFLSLVRSDGALIVARVGYVRGEVRAITQLAVVPVDKEVVAAAVSSAHAVVFASAGDVVLALDLGLMRVVWRVALAFAVTHVAVDDLGAVVFAAGGADVAVLSVSGEKLIEARMQASVTALAAANAPPWAERCGCITGHADGTVAAWAIRWADVSIVQEGVWQPAEDEVTALAVPQGGARIVVGTRAEVFVIEAREPTLRAGASGMLPTMALH
jgi:hypothetical protein